MATQTQHAVRESMTFRVFVSSAFRDLVAERNALQERVWPRLRELCLRHGARWDSNLTTPCAHCGERSVVTDDLPGQEIECPLCKGTLSLTPFVCDNR